MSTTRTRKSTTTGDVVALPGAADTPGPRLVELPIAEVHPDPSNPRSTLEGIDELAESIGAHGILEPLVVTSRATGGGWQVLAGHRRLAAARVAGAATVPCVVRDDLDAAHDDLARLEAQLVENLARDDLAPLDEARALRTLLDATGLSQRQLAGRVGRNQSHISRRLALLALPDPVQAKVAGGEISVEAAGQLTRLAEHPDRLQRVVDEAQQMDWDPEELRWSIETELDQAVIADKRDLARAECDAAGITVLERNQSWWNHGEKVRPIGKGYEYLWSTKAPTKAKLAKAGHLAAVIRGPHHRDAEPEIVYVCTDSHVYDPPASTSGGNVGEALADHDERRARSLEAAARKETAKARLAPAVSWFRDAAAGNTTALLRDALAVSGADEVLPGLLELTARDAIPRFCTVPVARIVGLLLGVDTDGQSFDWAVEHRDPVLVAAALRVARLEDQLSHDLRPDGAEEYYRWLATLGYQPTDAERERLGWPADAKGRRRAS